MTIAPFVRILGVGPGRARSLTQDEATEAMSLILQDEAAPEAIGAMFMLMRMKGETPEEIAGLTAALRASIPDIPKPALDWPAYAAGRTRGLPWFLLSARLVAQAGYPVLIHGWNGMGSAGSDVMRALPFAGIEVAENTAHVTTLLDGQGIGYAPLEMLSPRLLHLLKMRQHLGLRSCLNTVARMLNPGQADALVQGVFHPSYRSLQAEACAILGQQSMTVIKGGGGEFERHPTKAIAGFGLRGGEHWQTSYPALLPDETRRLNDGEEDPARLAALWDGLLDDPFSAAIVIGTAALALDTLGVPSFQQVAQQLWADRLG